MWTDDVARIWTIGHSTRAFEEFLALLKEHRIGRLVDVRHFPSSERVPWADGPQLKEALEDAGIRYRHLVDLGGYRKAKPDSRNTGWRSSGFRGYADHMETAAFQAALESLLAEAADARTCVMCAEAVPWRCHRSLLSDALLARGAKVVHILGPGSSQGHKLTPFAKVRAGRVTYPGPKAKGHKRASRSHGRQRNRARTVH